jgi:hypothetical protein
MATLDAADGEAAAKRQRVGGWAENCLNQGCRSVQCFRKLNRIWGAAVGSGRYDFPSFFHRLKKTISGWTIISHRFHFQLLAPPKKTATKTPRKTVTGRGIDEGTYGVVYRACEIDTGEVVALKQLKLGAVKSEEGFPVPGLPGLG